MPKSAFFAIAVRDFPNVFDTRFRENRLLGHAPSEAPPQTAEIRLAREFTSQLPRYFISTLLNLLSTLSNRRSIFWSNWVIRSCLRP